MSTIEEKLNTLQNTKTDIAAAINELGVEVTETEPFAMYATRIRSIHIPTNVSELENDMNYQTADDVAEAIQNAQLSSGDLIETEEKQFVSAAEKALYADKYTKSETDSMLAGKASLVNGYVPSEQLPSYVDDVLEHSSRSVFPSTGETGKIYVDTTNNVVYRWTGSTYVEISNPIDFATTEEAKAGTNNTKAMTPLRTKEAIDNSLVAVNEAIATNAENIEKVQLGAITSVSWEDVKNKPSTFEPASHTHTKANITDFPTTLKNPTALTITVGNETITYDGSAAKTVNVSLDNIGAVNENHTHAASAITAMTGYSMADDVAAISASDNLLTAVGKLEKQVEDVNLQIGNIGAILDAINGSTPNLIVY